LVTETRTPLPIQPGRPARYDYEYERNGTASLFMLFAPLEGWRHVKVTERRTTIDYAQVLGSALPRACSNCGHVVLAEVSSAEPAGSRAGVRQIPPKPPTAVGRLLRRVRSLLRLN